MDKAQEAKMVLTEAISVINHAQRYVSYLDYVKKIINSTIETVGKMQGPVRWINVFEKNSGTEFVTFHCDSNLYNSEEQARLARGLSTGSSKNKYLGAFPVVFADRPENPALKPVAQTVTVPSVSYADMSYAQQQELMKAARLYYLHETPVSMNTGGRQIQTIRHIRFICGGGLKECKDLVQYVNDPVTYPRPVWLKTPVGLDREQ